MNQYIMLTLVALSCVIATTSAMKCYDCTSTNKGQNCLQPGTNLLKDCGSSVGVCYKSYSKVGTVESTTRGCGRYSGSAGTGLGDNQCQDHDVESVNTNICNCNTDSCNSAISFTRTSMSAVGLSVAFAILMSKLF